MRGSGGVERAGRLAFALVASLASAAPVAAARPPALFAQDDLVELTLEAPLRELARGRPREGDLQAIVRLADGSELPVRVTTYGKSRLRICALPPLQLAVTPATAVGTPFEGLESVRLITHCRRHSVFERAMLREYLAYRAWAVVAEPALRVRLARIEYRDSRKPAVQGDTRHGFFVEEIDDAATRLGLSRMGVKYQRSDRLDADQATIHALFQLMIGNTDWSSLAGPEAESCCHNIALLEDPASGRRALLPYDFDQSGLVSAPYAVPDEDLGIEDVRQRVYRGFCRHNEALAAAVERFSERRDELEALFHDDSLPDPRGRGEAWEYLTGFFELLDKPTRFDSLVVRRCRRAPG